MIERSSSIVAIKNNANPRKYLLYHDNGWNVDFFPNFTNYKKNSDTDIKHKLSEALGIKEDQIDIKLATSGTEEKPSTEHNNETRRYFYDVYYATISDFEYTLSSSFNIDGREYKWLTFDEMLADEAIQKNNSYLVKLVKDNTI